MSCVDVLVHPFLEDGRMRYHTCLCSCCRTAISGARQFSTDLEPSCMERFDPFYEKELNSIPKAKGIISYFDVCNRTK